ncbi:MAG: DUF1702 family protein [Deltaproteobacteria bacterium]|nr:DUF1702 family protein [Deltaproteobacteria bacterium]MBW2419580.1 DUF1702 family protein [Deltaproteobacteria bacterium]
MSRHVASLRRRLFGIDPAEVTFARRGFDLGARETVERLERIGGTFVEGYHAALESPEPVELERALGRIEVPYQGFAFEGAGMALALLDRVTPWRRNRLADFLRGPGEPHVYMVTIGAGWAWARLGSHLGRMLGQLDSLLGWLALDGYGFHEGYFHPGRTIDEQQLPRQVKGYRVRVFDTGVGRSLWFVSCADPDAAADRIRRFDTPRQADLWAGLGLACTYAGGAGEAGIERLLELAGPHRASLAQGSAFAAKARQRAGLPAEHTRRAVEAICGTTVDLAAKVCDSELPDARDADETAAAELPAFERWRSGIRASLASGFQNDLAQERRA